MSLETHSRFSMKYHLFEADDSSKCKNELLIQMLAVLNRCCTIFLVKLSYEI